MLDLDPSRQGPTPRDSSTLVVVRDRAGSGLSATARAAAEPVATTQAAEAAAATAAGAPSKDGIEVFCVERHKTGFLGGAVVFPGGKVDSGDLDPAWTDLVTGPAPARTAIAGDEAMHRALAIAACREALEEAAILPLVGAPLSHAELLAWRTELLRARGDAREAEALRALLRGHGRKLDLEALHPLARWITPLAESRRFDTRFFVFAATDAVTGAHDDRETTASFWATPAEVLERFAARALVLAPPTHRMLEVLSTACSTAEVLALAARATLEPICPRVVTQHGAGGDTMAIALPGDPEHDVREARVAGSSRFVLRDGLFVPEDPPA